MIRLNEIFPPRPSMEQLGIEARRQAYSAVTGKVLEKGIIPDVQMFDAQGQIAMPTVFGYPNIFAAMAVGRYLRRMGPTLDFIDVDGVIIPNSIEDYDKTGLGRLLGNKSIRSVMMRSGVNDIAEIPRRENGTDSKNISQQPALALSRSFGFWPRQGVLRKTLDGESISFIDSFDRHHPPEAKSKTPKIWKIFENTLIELIKPLDLSGRILNLNHHGDILPPVAFLAGNEGVIINWLSKFFTGMEIRTNPNITFINPSFPKTGMILDPGTFEFLPFKGAEV